MASFIRYDVVGSHAARRFAEAHFLSPNGMEELHGLRRTLGAQLADIGFARSSAQAAERAEANESTTQPTTQPASESPNLVRALVCAGLYPNLVRVRMPDTKYVATAQGAIEAANDDARAIRFYTLPNSRVFLHPSCALFTETAFNARWLVYTSKQQVAAEKVYVRDVSAVSPLALLLFGGEVQVSHSSGTVTIDGQISFEAPGRVAVLVRELRAELDKLLAEKLADPSLEIGAHPVVKAIVNLINTERAGFS